MSLQGFRIILLQTDEYLEKKSVRKHDLYPPHMYNSNDIIRGIVLNLFMFFKIYRWLTISHCGSFHIGIVDFEFRCEFAKRQSPQNTLQVNPQRMSSI